MPNDSVLKPAIVGGQIPVEGTCALARTVGIVASPNHLGTNDAVNLMLGTFKSPPEAQPFAQRLAEPYRECPNAFAECHPIHFAL